MSDTHENDQKDMFVSGSSNDTPRREALSHDDVSQNASSHDAVSRSNAHDMPQDSADHDTGMSEHTTESDIADEQNDMHGYDLAGYVFGALDAEETTRVRAAIAADPKLRAEVQKMESVLTEFALLAPRQQINRGRSAGIRSRLVARAASTRDGRLPSARQGSTPSKQNIPIAESGSLSARKSAQSNRTTGSNGVTSGTTPSVTTRSGSTQMGSGSSGLSDLRADPQSATRAEESRIATPGGHASTDHAQAGSSKSQPVRRSGAIRGGAWFGLAVALAVVVGGLQEWRMRHSQDQLRLSIASRDSSLTTQVASLESAIVQKDSIIEMLIGPNMKVVNMVSSAAQDPGARMFWDQKSHEWTMRAYNLRAPRPGRTYQVWLIASNSPKPISAGTFVPDADGSAIMVAKYELPKNALVQVAISEEPVGGVPEPTGPIIVAGK